MRTTGHRELFAELLPADAGGFVVGDDDARALARELGGRFRPLTPAELAAERTGSGSRVGAAIVLGDAVPVADFELLADALELGGRLILRPPDHRTFAPAETRRLSLALAAAGFVVLRATPEAIAARREPFVVRSYRPGDEDRILPLFATSFHQHRSREKFDWIYRRNPLGNGKISLAFREDGELVAQYAGYPVRLRRPEPQGEPLLALQIGDLMSAPAVRHVGRGPTSLFGRTARHFYASFCEEQVAFNFGVNTGTSLGFALRFTGARLLEAAPYHSRPARQPVPRSLRSRWRGDRIERLRSVDGRFDELFDRVAPHYGLLAERGAEYLQRRYFDCPDTEFALWANFRRERLVGWSVFRTRGQDRETLVWGDALFDPSAAGAVENLLAHSLADPEHSAATTIETWLCPRPAAWSRQVRSLGFDPQGEPNGLSVVYVPFGLRDESELRERWYYTMGDFDLF
ncbi:MAG: GNAT family N-acetyltransferase [Thermoanaerobaculia bacterium]